MVGFYYPDICKYLSNDLIFPRGRKAKRLCEIHQGTARALSVLYSCLFYSSFQTHKEVGKKRIAYWCVRDSEAGLLWRAHEVYMLVLVLVLPLIIMAFCYTSICWEIWRVMKRRYHMTSRHA